MAIARDTILKLCQTTNPNHSTWVRFQPLVEMALEMNDSHCSSSRSRRSNLADLGTDHGLLALGLAATNHFDAVTGVDASRRALENGAWATVAQWKNRGIPPLPTSLQPFLHGDGLQACHHHHHCGQTDMICLAGMGVNTMQDILTAVDNDTGNLLINICNVKVVLTQPTNTRPRNLIALYTCLVGQLGFAVQQEHLCHLSGRWYVSTAFVRREKQASNTTTVLTTDDLPLSHYRGKDPALRQGYVNHHVNWLQKELGQAGKLRGREDEWLAKFEPMLLNAQAGMVSDEDDDDDDDETNSKDRNSNK